RHLLHHHGRRVRERAGASGRRGLPGAHGARRRRVREDVGRGLGVRRCAIAVCYAALLALAVGAAGRIYHGPLFAWLTAGAAVGSVGIGLLPARRPQWMVAPVSVLAMLGYLIFTVWYSGRAAGISGTLPGNLVEAMRNGGPRLLTALIPVEAEPDTVLVPV